MRVLHRAVISRKKSSKKINEIKMAMILFHKQKNSNSKD